MVTDTVVFFVCRVYDRQGRAGVPGAERKGSRAETDPQQNPRRNQRPRPLSADNQVRTLNDDFVF